MIITAGELLVEFVSFKKNCGLRQKTTFSGPFPSGAAAIFANQVAQMGAESCMIGTIGKDPFGMVITDRLEKDGVDVSFIRTHAIHTTGTAFVSYYDNGDRIFVFHLDGTAADDIHYQEGCFNKGDKVHVSGASLGNAKIRSVILQLVEEASIHGKVSFDPNIRKELINDDNTRNALFYILEKTDIFVPSADDVDFLFPNTSYDVVIDKMFQSGKEIVAIKRGSLGVIGGTVDTIFDLSGHIVAEVDPTGAGDCFCGAFLGAIECGVSIEDALKYANGAGALHVTKVGPMEYNPTLETIKKFIQHGQGI